MKQAIYKTTVLAFALVLVMGLCIGLSACGGSEEGGSAEAEKDGNTLVYGSGDYTRINPAIDEHGEINLLLFDGLRTMNTVKILWGSLLSAILAVSANGILKWAEKGVSG